MKKIKLLLATLLLSTGLCFGSATDFWITQNGATTKTGATLATAAACDTTANTAQSTCAAFNNASNWGVGAAQIGVGTTVHLSGTFNAAQQLSGTCVSIATCGYFSVLGNGTSSSPITIQFETGAVVTSPAFGGNPGNGFEQAAIVLRGVSFVTINGQSSAIIQNTSNGSPGQTTCLIGTCTIQQISNGIWVSQTTNVIIEGLTIQNIYMDLAGEGGNNESSAAWNTGDITVDGPNTNLTIQRNTLKDSHWGIGNDFEYGNTPNFDIINNTIQHHAWQISWGNGGSTTFSSSGIVTGNYISNYDDWNGGGETHFHTDGIIDFTMNGAPTFEPIIYSNYFAGDLSGGTSSGTAYLSCGSNTGSGNNLAGTCSVFNNVLDMSTSSHCAAAIAPQGQASLFANNTIVGNSSCIIVETIPDIGFVFYSGDALGNDASDSTIQNNIFSNVAQPYWASDGGTITNQITASDFNVFFSGQDFNMGGPCNTSGSQICTSLAIWNTKTGFDSHSTTSSPNLNSSFLPQAPSSAFNFGTNLTGVAPAAWNISAPQTFGVSGSCGTGCVPRLGSGPVDAGAYESVSPALFISSVGTGSHTGLSCASAEPYSYFNSTTNWSSTPSGIQIGPGATVHVCAETYQDATANDTALNFRCSTANGTSGNPITLIFDQGTTNLFNSNNWASTGAITGTGACAWLVIDGQNNLTIGNELSGAPKNGTGIGPAATSSGIFFPSGLTHSTIKNTTVRNIYINNPSSSSQAGSATIGIGIAGAATSTQLLNNTVSSARAGISIDWEAAVDASNFVVANNTVSDTGWSLSFGSCNSSATATGVVFHDNNFSNWTNWGTGSVLYHSDGIILFNDAGPVSPDNPTCPGQTATPATATYSIYNNFFSGSLGTASPTGYIACGVNSQCTIFNNLMVDGGVNPINGYIWLYSPNGADLVYSNTLIGSSFNGNIAITLGDTDGTGLTRTQSHLTVYDNIFFGVGVGIHDYGTLTSDVVASDYNIFRTNLNSLNAPPDMATNDVCALTFSGSLTTGPCGTIPSWAVDGFDLHSVTTNPNLNANYTLSGSSSPAHNLGTNLTGIAPALWDISSPQFFGVSGSCGTQCVLRPAVGSVDAGVYQLPIPTQVSAPTFSPVAGTYTSNQSITISTSTSGATLCYTIDGTTPTTNGAGTCTHGNTYTSVVPVAATTTIKVVGTLSGLTDSSASTSLYIINNAIWSSVLNSNRAAPWNPGATISTTRTQCGSTVAPGASAVTINAALAACPANTYLLLSSGTVASPVVYTLTSSLCFATGTSCSGVESNVTLRGGGPKLTVLKFTGSVGCPEGPAALICINGSFNYTGSLQNGPVSWTAGFGQNATSITLSSVASMSVGQHILLDQANDIIDSNQVFVCNNNDIGASTWLGCDNTGNGSSGTGRIVGGVTYSQQQIVKVTDCRTDHATTGSCNTTTITISPGIYMPNWNAAKTPGAWWATTTAQNDGVENLSIDATAATTSSYTIFFANATGGWVKNVRSLNADRAHVEIQYSDHITVRDSYLYGTQNAASQSYGVEEFNGGDDILVENNIFQHITTPLLLNGTVGSVFAYNYDIDNFNNNSTFQYPGTSWNHSAGADMNLDEGNEGATFIEDAIHGSHNFGTSFRSWLYAQENCGNGQPGKNQQTVSVILQSHSRYDNIVGNVMGCPGYNTTYTATEPTITGCDTAIYNLGFSGPECTTDSGQAKVAWVLNTNYFNGSILFPTSGNAGLFYFESLASCRSGGTQPTTWNQTIGGTTTDNTCTWNNIGLSRVVPLDSLVATTLMRWGNYDTASAANRFCGLGAAGFSSAPCSSVSEIPSAITDGSGTPSLYVNPVPATTTLPNSFYLSAKPTFWSMASPMITPPWPGIGPDITGGNGPGGHAYDIPAAVCYQNSLLDSNYTTTYTVSAGTWSGGIATITVGSSTVAVGDYILVSGMSPTGWNNGGLPALVTFVTPTTGNQISYQLSSNPGVLTTFGQIKDTLIISYDANSCYQLSTQAITPTFSPVAGIYTSAQHVTLSTLTIGASICYTTDGTIPTSNGAGTCTSGNTYTSPVTVSVTETITAIASAVGLTDSSASASIYTITSGKCVTPAFCAYNGTDIINPTTTPDLGNATNNNATIFDISFCGHTNFDGSIFPAFPDCLPFLSPVTRLTDAFSIPGRNLFSRASGVGGSGVFVTVNRNSTLVGINDIGNEDVCLFNPSTGHCDSTRGTNGWITTDLNTACHPTPPTPPAGDCNAGHVQDFGSMSFSLTDAKNSTTSHLYTFGQDSYDITSGNLYSATTVCPYSINTVTGAYTLNTCLLDWKFGLPMLTAANGGITNAWAPSTTYQYGDYVIHPLDLTEMAKGTGKWVASTAYVAGDILVAQSGAQCMYRAIVSGTSAPPPSTGPSFDTTLPCGLDTISDGTVKWRGTNGPAQFIYQNVSACPSGCLSNNTKFVWLQPASQLAINGSMTSGSATLTSSSNPFSASMVGSAICVTGAGNSAGNAPLCGTIFSYTGIGTVTLSVPALHTITTSGIITLSGHPDFFSSTPPNPSATPTYGDANGLVWVNLGLSYLPTIGNQLWEAEGGISRDTMYGGNPSKYGIAISTNTYGTAAATTYSSAGVIAVQGYNKFNSDQGTGIWNLMYDSTVGTGGTYHLVNTATGIWTDYTCGSGNGFTCTSLSSAVVGTLTIISNPFGTGQPCPFYIHNQKLSKNGLHAVITNQANLYAACNSLPQGNDGFLVWQTTSQPSSMFNAVTSLNLPFQGFNHWDIGTDQIVVFNPSGWTGGFLAEYNAASPATIPNQAKFSTWLAPNVNLATCSPTTGICTGTNPPSFGCHTVKGTSPDCTLADVFDSHLSVAADDGTDTVPACGTTYNFATLGPAFNAWQNKETCYPVTPQYGATQSNSVGPVYQFTNWFNSGTNLDFSIQYGVSQYSQDGNWLFWSSDWNCTLGSTNNVTPSLWTSGSHYQMLSVSAVPTNPSSICGPTWASSNPYIMGNMINPIENATSNGGADDVFQALTNGTSGSKSIGPLGNPKCGTASCFGTTNPPTLTVGPFAVTSVTGPVSGNMTYGGTITSGSGNAYGGHTFQITNFSNPLNNGTFVCTTSTSSTLVCANPTGVAQSGQTATAIEPGFAVTTVSAYSGSTATITVPLTWKTSSPTESGLLVNVGALVSLQGFQPSGWNGIFSVTGTVGAGCPGAGCVSVTAIQLTGFPTGLAAVTTFGTAAAEGDTICDTTVPGTTPAFYNPQPPYATSCPVSGVGAGVVWQDLGLQTGRGDVFAVNLSPGQAAVAPPTLLAPTVVGLFAGNGPRREYQMPYAEDRHDSEQPSLYF